MSADNQNDPPQQPASDRASAPRASAGALTRAQIAEAIYTEVGLSRHESAKLLEAVLEAVASALEAGASVKISGFGAFSVRQKGQRIGRNPKTGVEVSILPRRVIVFRPSQTLKAILNGAAMADGGGE